MPSIAISLSLRGQLLSGSRFEPSALFSANEPGVWYDLSDLTTLFQDAAGTTPVTAPGQSVGLVLDKSQGLVLGPELWADQTPTVTNFNGSAGAYNGATNTMSNGSAGGSSGWPRFSFNLGLTVGKRYQVEIALSGDVAKVTNINAGVGSGFIGGTGATRSGILEAIGASLVIQTSPDTGWAVALASVSVREILGNHATQATAAARPTYGVVPKTGLRNLLTYTEQFDNAVWSKVSATVTSVEEGAWRISGGAILQNYGGSGVTTVTFEVKADTATTVDVQLGSTVASRVRLTFSTGLISVVGEDIIKSEVEALGNGWFRVKISGTASGNRQAQLTLTTGSVFARFPQVELGSVATPYQKVVSAFDVTEAGVPSLGYLSFDGVDDWLVTPTITPGIDKVQVFAGVRKLSDAVSGNMVELSTSALDNPGAFLVRAPQGAAPNYSWFSRGDGSLVQASASSYSAPITNVLTGIGDISGDLATIRVNGTQAAQNTADQGTGNFNAYPLYIGRRGGTTLPFNGRIYGLIVRFGANLTSDQITQTETWMNSKTGAF